MISRRPRLRRGRCYFVEPDGIHACRRKIQNMIQKTIPYFFFISVACSLRAQLITSIPGPDDQGGMIMPMFSITATSGTGANPTAGIVNVSFSPVSVPKMQSLQQWSPGSWFADTAAWRPDLGSASGVGGTPAANSGSGDLFNNQYGFTFMGNGSTMMSFIPTGKSLGIKLLSVSSPLLETYNYGNAQNRWDRIFDAANSQVLWNGSMWHSYFTLPGGAVGGTYSAMFEIFVANQTFTAGTGFADYSAAAKAAAKDANFTPATVNYTWTVVPEPSIGALLVSGLAFAVVGRCLRKRLRE